MDAPLPRRKNPRLRNFDYASNAAYFITVCTHRRLHSLGDVIDEALIPTQLGLLVQECWNEITVSSQHVALDAFTLMPNHIHGIVILPPPDAMERTFTLGEIVRGLKARTTVQARQRLGLASPIWQRNYYEHVIRKDEDMNRIRQYIIDNPKHWDDDEENLS